MNLQNITRDSIIKAIKEIDNNPKLRSGVSSTTYDVLFDNKRYPPKLIISTAYNQIENKSINTTSFHGGLNTECFNVIESLGFKIVSKDKQNYFLFSPGENANKWAEFCDEGKMAMGWHIGDISKLKTYKKIEETLKETHNKKNQSSAAKANWQFLNLLKEGDIIIPKKGQRKILGYGIVKSDYYYDEIKKDEGYECVRKVEWKEIGEWDYTIKRRDTLQRIDTKQEIHEIEKLIGGFDNYESEKNLNFHNKLDLILIDDFIFLLEKIDEIILSLGLVQSDKRLTFSAEGDTLSFHIGNKYIIAYTLLKQSYFLLTLDKIKIDLPNLEMSRNTLLYKNANKANIEQNISHIIDVTKKELLKKDEFPKYDSSDFRKVVFNMKYRKEILNNMKKESVQNKELLVNEFLNKWPVSRIKKLKLTEYTNKNKDSFTWDMEKGLLKFIAPIESSRKGQFGVYASTASYEKKLIEYKNGTAKYKDYGWQTKWSPNKPGSKTNKDEAYKNVLESINDVIEFAQKGELTKINEVELAPLYKWKIAFVYGKQQVMSIPKSSVLESALVEKSIIFNKNDVASMHEKLLSLKPEEVRFYDYCSDIYDKYSGGGESNDNYENVMAYEIKHSAHPSFLRLLHENGKYFYWNQRKFDKLELGDKVFLVDNVNKRYCAFLELDKKDIVVEENGDNIGFTDKGQIFRVEEGSENFVRLKVVYKVEEDFKWTTLGTPDSTYFFRSSDSSKKLTSSNVTKRIPELKDIFTDYIDVLDVLNFCLDYSEIVIPKPDYKIEQKLNRILFGPPGTGKTFSTINHALSILEDSSLDKLKVEKREDVRERYEEFVNNKQIRVTTFHQSYSYEDFIEGIRPKLKSIKDKNGNEERKEISYETVDGVFKNIVTDAINNYPEKYVLIIDEINRGNISDILGELITLLEPSKRKEGDEPTIVTLPYSQKPFEIPNNIYIIGTMNTADRSISVLDTALRRRFRFIELPPNYKSLTSVLIEKKVTEEKLEGIDLIKLLKKINERIGFLLDKDHMIGHTEFMNVTSKKKLVDLFANYIIPLLEEYFHNDYENIQRVLGDNDDWHKKEENRIFQEEKEKNSHDLFGGEVDGFDDVKTFKLNKYFLNESEFSKVPSEVFTQIYEQEKSKSE